MSVSWVEDDRGPMIHGADEGVAHLPRDAIVRFPVLAMMNDSGGTLHLAWEDDDGREYEERQSVRL